MKRKRKSFFKQNKLALVLFVGFFLYVSMTLVNQELKARELRLEEAALRQQISAMNIELEDLKKEVESAASLEHIEDLAREKLKMIKSDELIYFMLPDSEKKN
jgi:cell division protein FtsL